MKLRFESSRTTRVRFFSSRRELEAALKARAAFTLLDPHSGIKARGHVRKLPPGEACKSWDTLGATLAWLAEQEAERGAWLAGVGGGATLDLAGFAASLYRRGMPLLFVPTTLLGMVDATLGGKTAVDGSAGGTLLKNFAGTFYPADEVWISTDYLTTLPRRERLSGAGECLKTLWIAGRAVSYPALTDYTNGGAPDARLARIIKTCLKEKLRVVEQDPLDVKGVREVLNYGHTVGHALEALAHGRLSHGECVLWGMFVETRLLGRRAAPMVAELRHAFELLGLALPKELLRPAEAWLPLFRGDKKAAGGKLALSVLRAPGAVERLRISPEALARTMGEGRHLRFSS